MVSGNRNELLKRPASTLELHGGVLAPRDDVHGGTWLGLNQHGLFVVITNRAGAMIDPARRSRGLIVREALGAGSARELHQRLRDLDGARYNGFHLVYADLEEAFVTWGDGTRARQLPLASGDLHVITERSYGAGEGQREREVRAAFTGLDEDVRAWRAPMTTHATMPLESACVHADAVGYGTRSSLQLVLRAGGRGEALWTDGHPCRNPARTIAL